MKKLSNEFSHSDMTQSQIFLEKRRYKNSPTPIKSVTLNTNPEFMPVPKAERLKEFHSDSFFWRPPTASTFNETSLNKFNDRKFLNGPGPGKYGRQSSIGHVNHDITLHKHPAYSIGKAGRVTELNSGIFYWRPGTGESAIRPGTSTINLINGPGPGKYSRATSIGHLNTDVTLPKTPAYTIGKTERAFNFTSSPFYSRAKTPGSASTPGPAAYNYEQHQNAYKSKVPAYSIGRAQRFPSIIV